MLEPDSILILFSAEKKNRNRDVFYEYRNSSDMLYLTGYNEPDMKLCVTSEKKLTFFIKFPDVKIERWTGKMLSAESVRSGFHLEADDVREEKKFWNDIPELLKNKKTVYLDFSANNENISQLIAIINDLNKNTRDATSGPEKIIHISQVLHESRVLKTKNELQKIKKAIEITAQGFIEIMRHTRRVVKQNPTSLFEYNVKARIESSFKDNGAMNLAYPTIVASGNNANYLHYENFNRSIGINDLILVDAGCEWQGYASDITRTIPASGKFTAPQKKIYNIVLEAQKAALRNCIPGNTFEMVHDSAVRYIVEGLWELGLFKEIIDINDRQNDKVNDTDEPKLIKPASISEVIEKKYYRIYYMHYTSHYLGLDVHDVGGYFVEGKSRTLQNGMVFTVEPGIYISEDYHFVPQEFRGIGIRIEDNILITENGHEILSENIPREVDEIESIE